MFCPSFAKLRRRAHEPSGKSQKRLTPEASPRRGAGNGTPRASQTSFNGHRQTWEEEELRHEAHDEHRFEGGPCLVVGRIRDTRGSNRCLYPRNNRGGSAVREM